MLAIYFFGGAGYIDELANVPLHRIEEARIILVAQHQAEVTLAKQNLPALLPRF